MGGNELLLVVSAFGGVGSLALIVGLLLAPKGQLDRARLQAAARVKRGSERLLEDQLAQRAGLQRVGAALLPKDATKLGRLKARMIQAGLYQRNSTVFFVLTKFVLLVVPVLVGIGLSSMRMISLNEGILIGIILGLTGNLAPSLWLSRLKKRRQTSIRRAIPDALDVIVICLEGGLSLPAAFARVSSELRNAHPLLADEMAIVQREIQLGRTTGQALRQFADRFDAADLRSMASVVTQAERFGASVVKAFRIHADTLRLKRYQYAEAQAQKAPVKLIFPTVLFIFPALYIILMGPAGVHLWDMLNNLN